MDKYILPTNFPIKGKGIRAVLLELYEFDKTVMGEEAVRWIEEEGQYQLEGIAELLAFAKANPMAQLRRPVVALGSLWMGRGCADAPYLGGAFSRHLGLHYLGNEFHPNFQFLVSRKDK